jgi:hypothetical protein
MRMLPWLPSGKKLSMRTIGSSALSNSISQRCRLAPSHRNASSCVSPIFFSFANPWRVVIMVSREVASTKMMSVHKSRVFSIVLSAI